MKLSDIKTEVVGLAEICPHSLIVHEGGLFVFLHHNVANQLVGIQSLAPGLPMQTLSVTNDTLFEKVVTVRIHQ